ncbi:hypothetical protein HN587_03015 [Candidatus Woesearchaeota archaeon]|nr:hypothetical protein [Candidatus Woesearchaeota archaeon]
MFGKRGNSKDNIKLATDLVNIQTNLKHSFSKIKEEFDDHIQSINDNTSELTVLEGNVCEVDKRLTKLEEKMDNIHMILKTLLSQSHLNIELNQDEQKLFLLLYTSDEAMNRKEISTKISLEEETVSELILSMTDKGIPLHRINTTHETHFKLDEEFRLAQAREKIIKICPEVNQQYQNKLLFSFFNE